MGLNVLSKGIILDSIFLTDLKIEASVGVYDWEKKVLQPLHIDATLMADLKPAGQSDDLNQSIDYAFVADEIQRIASQKHYELLEHLAETLCDYLLSMPLVQAVTLGIHKPYALPNVGRVGVRIERHQTEAS